MKKPVHCRVHRARTAFGLAVGFYRKREGEKEMEGGGGSQRREGIKIKEGEGEWKWGRRLKKGRGAGGGQNLNADATEWRGLVPVMVKMIMVIRATFRVGPFVGNYEPPKKLEPEKLFDYTARSGVNRPIERATQGFFRFREPARHYDASFPENLGPPSRSPKTFPVYN
jgi:hypothetical protein